MPKWNPAKYEFFFSRKLKRIEIPNLGDIKKWLRKGKRYLDMSRYIQPTIDIFTLLPVKIGRKSKTATAGTVIIDIEAPKRETWLIDNINVTHNDVAARDFRMNLFDQNETIDISSFHTIPNNAETPIFPVVHEVTAGGTDHIIGFKRLWVKNPDISVQVIGKTITVGKEVDVRWTYRRVP